MDRDTFQTENDASRVHALAEAGIAVRSVVKEFDLGQGKRLRAVDGVSINIAEGEFVAIIGPSGCGKSTILRMIASLEMPTEGEVRINGAEPSELAKGHRLGVAFQDHALLPWLTAWENVALPFRAAGVRPDPERIESLISLVGMAGFEKSRPKQLSGGMKQRIAIARALALKPDVLLLDEPFGALDAVTRRQMNIELQDIWSRDSITTLLITHSVEEAVFLADRLVVLTERPGQIKLIEKVPFDRPRDRALMLTPEFHQLCDRLTESLDKADQDHLIYIDNELDK